MFDNIFIPPTLFTNLIMARTKQTQRFLRPVLTTIKMATNEVCKAELTSDNDETSVSESDVSALTDTELTESITKLKEDFTNKIKSEHATKLDGRKETDEKKEDDCCPSFNSEATDYPNEANDEDPQKMMNAAHLDVANSDSTIIDNKLTTRQ